MKNAKFDIAGLDYRTVRDAFHETLRLCLSRLSDAELGLAEEILGYGDEDEAEY